MKYGRLAYETRRGRVCQTAATASNVCASAASHIAVNGTPLLTAASLAGTTQQLDMWLGSVNVYLRESPQDKGLLILSRQPLEKKLLAAGIDVPLPLDHKQQHPVNGASHA